MYTNNVVTIKLTDRAYDILTRTTKAGVDPSVYICNLITNSRTNKQCRNSVLAHIAELQNLIKYADEPLRTKLSKEVSTICRQLF